MKLIIPMAGQGTRLRPHTLLTPKPLFSIAGQTIVERLLHQIKALFPQEKITDIGFVMGAFGYDIEQQMQRLAQKLEAQAHIFIQQKPLGTADAVACASSLLEGKVMVAFADTLFDFKDKTTWEDPEEIGIFVKKVKDPSAFGVIQQDETGKIIEFVEKPKHFISDLAMIGVYYFAQAEKLKTALDEVLHEPLIKEYQFPDALRKMMHQNLSVKPVFVDEWLDCGNSKAVLEAHHYVLQQTEYEDKKNAYKIENSVLIPPYFIGKNVEIYNSIIGPFVSLEEGSKIYNSQVTESMIGKNATVNDAHLKTSILGEKVEVWGESKVVNLGAYSYAEI